MKRIFPLILTVLLIPALLAVPVMADELDLTYYNAMDYAYPNDTPGFTSLGFADTGILFFTLPNRSLISYVDFVFTCTKDVSGVYVVQGKESTTDISNQLTVVKIDNRNYRAYGEITPQDGSRIIFKFVTSGSTYVRPLRVNVSTQAVVTKEMDVDAEISDYSRNPALFYNLSYRGTPVITYWNTATSATYSQTYRAELVLYDWQAYDYIDLLLATNCSSFTSFNSLLGGIVGTSVPYSINFIDSSNAENPAMYIVSVRLDISDVKRSVNSLLVQLTAQQTVGGGENSFQIMSCTGLILQSPVQPWFHWFNSLKGWLDSGFSSIVDALGGSNDASGVTDEINTAVGQLQQAGAALDSVQRPDLGKVDINVVGMVDPAGLTGVSSIVGLFTGNSLIYTIMLMFLTLALISYILFGKR